MLVSAPLCFCRRLLAGTSYRPRALVDGIVSPLYDGEHLPSGVARISFRLPARRSLRRFPNRLSPSTDTTALQISTVPRPICGPPSPNGSSSRLRRRVPNSQPISPFRKERSSRIVGYSVLMREVTELEESRRQVNYPTLLAQVRSLRVGLPGSATRFFTDGRL